MYIFIILLLIVLIVFGILIYGRRNTALEDFKNVVYKDIDKINCILNQQNNFNDSVDQEIFDTIDVVMEPIDPALFYKLPEKGSKFAAGYDIYWSTVNKELNDDGCVIIEPGETLIFGTNLKIMITIDNFYLDICSRSGMAINKNLIVVNAPARIDSDYRGELLIGLKNISNVPVTIEPESRIAQCTLHRETNTDFILGNVIDNTERGEGGLGHSGY